MKARIQGVQVDLPMWPLLKLVVGHYLRDPARNLAKVMFPQAFPAERPWTPPTESEKAYYDSLHKETRDPKRWYSQGSFQEKARLARGAPAKSVCSGPALGNGISVMRGGEWVRVEKVDPSLQETPPSNHPPQEMETMPESEES